MTKLTKTQLSLLETLKTAGGPIPAGALEKKYLGTGKFSNDLAALIQTAFITKKAKSVCITEIGLAALEPAPTPSPQNAPKPNTKKARLIELLKADEGVTVPDLAQILGWLPHTTRAALTGLKKGGIAIQKLPPHDGSRSSRYTLASASVGGSL